MMGHLKEVAKVSKRYPEIVYVPQQTLSAIENDDVIFSEYTHNFFCASNLCFPEASWTPSASYFVVRRPVQKK